MTANAPLYDRLYGLVCASGDRSKCAGRCEHEAGTYFGEHHDRCPIAEAEDDMHLRSVRMLRNQASANPLSGWPESFSAWVTTIWAELSAAEAQEQADG